MLDDADVRRAYRTQLAAKRAIDIVIAALGLLFVLPIVAVAAVLIRLADGGPVFFRQTRVGRSGRTFAMVKLRSMTVPAVGVEQQVTGVGRWIRRTSIDELPQLWNVLRGDMSIVGPRPEIPALVDQLGMVIPDYHLRHRVKVGMTGWAQVSGFRGPDTSLEERVVHDNYYIDHWSLWLDLVVIARTPFVLFRGR